MEPKEIIIGLLKRMEGVQIIDKTALNVVVSCPAISDIRLIKALCEKLNMRCETVQVDSILKIWHR